MLAEEKTETTELEETPAAAEPAGFEFDSEFQDKIAALAIRDPLFAGQTLGLIKPEYFENEALASIVRVMADHATVYKSTPSMGTIATVVKKAIVDKRIRRDLIDDVKDCLRRLKDTDLSDSAFVRKEVETFAKTKAVEQAILNSAILFEKNDFAAIAKLMTEATSVGAIEDDGDYDYWSEIETRTQYRKDLSDGKIKPDGISTGVKELDEVLYHGGWGRKELSCLLAPAKGGKSMGLAEFAKNASLAGRNVLYVTLEVSKRITADRLDANVSETAMRVLKDTPFAVKSKIEAAMKKAGAFRIREFASGTMKPSQLRRVIQQYRAKGLIFDLIVVDYADIMCPERITGEPREDSKSIYLDLRAIAFEEGAAVLSATQSNREGAKSATVEATDVAEDYNKIRIADEVISINATEAEKASGEMRLNFAASRNSGTGTMLRFRIDRERMRFITKFLNRER